jgi:hypothetical protein
LLDAQGAVRKDIFKPRGDIHLNAAGTTIVSLKIRQMLEIMLPAVPVPVPVQTPPAPVQTPPAKPQRTRVQAPVSDPAPVVANSSPVVGAPLVAVVNAPAVVQAPVVVQHVAVIDQGQVETPMETDEDEILARLFFKKYGRALPEKEKEKESEVDKINFVIDLTDEDEMEVATSEAPVAVVKTEPIEIVNVANINNVNNVNDGRRHSSRLERLELAKARKAITEFGKSLRKTEVIPDKEAPLAASNVIADNDTDMAEDVSAVNVVNHGSITTDEAIEMAEKAIAESDAAIVTNRDEFDD